jgi:hypothetical protein
VGYERAEVPPHLVGRNTVTGPTLQRLGSAMFGDEGLTTADASIDHESGSNMPAFQWRQSIKRTAQARHGKAAAGRTYEKLRSFPQTL